ncbi:unnamed protein product [Sphagnum jensenii]|uniref:Uncharacterized protein n=1 Tax=Sphagnum jensenii TaxID=128206 RepID=A0ABP0WH88_9BRYO
MFLLFILICKTFSMGVRSTMSPASMGTSVRPMSPSSNFTTYSLPRAVAAAGLEQESDYITPADIPMQGIQLSTKPKGGAGGGRGPMGAFRQLLNCSTHCFHHQQQLSIDLDGEDSPILVVLHNENPVADGSAGEGRNVSYTGEDSRLRTQMQAVLRHLEVRWQLFNEALSKFGDLDAMLAVCADKGRWRCYNRGTVQKEARLVDVLQSLIDRKLSMEVFIDTVTQLGPSGAMGFTIDSYGSWTQLQPYDSATANLALEVLLQDIKTRQIESHADIFSPSSQQQQPCVLEEDWYTLCDYKGNVVEEGKQVVIWEQCNSIWYIRGCLSYPSATL